MEQGYKRFTKTGEQMIDYCDLCEKEKLVERSECYALKVCKSCNENFPEDDYCKDMQQDR